MQDDSIMSISSDERGRSAGRFIPILSRVLGRAKNLSAQEATMEATNQANRIEKNIFETASSRIEYYDKMRDKMRILVQKAEEMENQQAQVAQEQNRQGMEATGPYHTLAPRDPRHAPTAQQHIELLQQHTQNAQANMQQNNYAHSNANHPSHTLSSANSYHQQGMRTLQADSAGQHNIQGHNMTQEMHGATRTMPGANGRTNYPHTTSQAMPTQNPTKPQAPGAAQPKRQTQAPNAPSGLQAAPAAQTQRPQTNNQPVAHPGTVKLGTTLPQLSSPATGTTSFPRTAPNTNPYANQGHQPGYHTGVAMQQPVRQEMQNTQNTQMRLLPGYHQGMPGPDGMPNYNVAGHGANGVGRQARPPANGAGNIPNHGAGIPPHILKEKWSLLSEQMHKVSNLPKEWVELGKKFLPTLDPLTDLSPDELHALSKFAAISLSAKGNAKGNSRPGIANPSKPVVSSDNIAPMSETPHSHHAPNLVAGIPQTLKNVAQPSATPMHTMPGAHASINLGGSQAATTMAEATNMKLQQTASSASRTHTMPAGGVPKTVQSYPRAASQNRSTPTTQPMTTTSATNSNTHPAASGVQTGANGAATHPTNTMQSNQSAAAAKANSTGVGASGRTTPGTGASSVSGANNPGNHPTNGAAPATRGTAAIAGQTSNPTPAAPAPMLSLEKARETLLAAIPNTRDKIRLINAKVREYLGGLSLPPSIDHSLFMLPEVPWWERPKRKLPTDNTLGADSHTISSSIIQLKRSKIAESSDASIPSRPPPVKIISESNATLIQTMKAVQGLREEVNSFCNVDHFFSLRYIQPDLAIIIPSILPFNSAPPSYCPACSDSLSQNGLNSNIVSFNPSNSDYLHLSQPQAESSAMQTDQDSQMMTSGISENVACCSSSTSLHSHLDTKNKECCVPGLMLDLRSPQYALADDFGAPRIVPHFSVRGCRFGRTFANTLKNMEENLKSTMKPRIYVRHVLERYKSWVQALTEMENELRNPLFHEVTFQETVRKTTQITPAKSLLHNRQNRSADRQYAASKKCRSQSYIQAHRTSQLEFGISFSSKGYPDLFVVLPIQYPVTRVQVFGIDTTNASIKSKMFNAIGALQQNTLTEILHAWLIFGAPA